MKKIISVLVILILFCGTVFNTEYIVKIWFKDFPIRKAKKM